MTSNEHAHLDIACVVSMPFQENTYIVRRPGGNEAFVVDPGFEPAPILEQLAEWQCIATAIVNTHGHPDHIAGNEAIKARFPAAPIVIGRGDADLLTDPVKNTSLLFGVPVTSPPADRLLVHGERVTLLGLEWEVREIPGHSPGHIVLVWHDGRPPIVLGGDVLFAGGIGRFDLPGGDGAALLSGIRRQLYTLPDDAIVYPGHGPATTIGVERATNPFTRAENHR